MIYGNGVDNIELSRIENALARNAKFAKRVLTDKELAKFMTLSGRRQIEFLGGRWAAKEAYAKAYGTGIGGYVSFQDLEVLPNQLGAPKFIRHPFSDRGVAHISISHSNLEAVAFVILESRE
ncbi:holo-ACP synthase [Lactococcus piscium]|uniref:Holo-[acyl-carrier-protein] synthase n=1 Tax=Pseudolactococcus paracarnosus TaxID=2749962 RepID=A0A7L4WDK1_9LACT|nr:holo-ACP synthase [Lactococcus paracarnosus]MCJ1994572.1 holo-ACP synthase [Lactococcus paracarnosus]QDJ28269.1 holo-ACP synthase [Lactococcus paracarnosus]SPC35325.1 holo-acyl carrier protein synthase [Lactococcus piscium]